MLSHRNDYFLVNRSYRRGSDDVVVIGDGVLGEEQLYDDVLEGGLYRTTQLLCGLPSNKDSDHVLSQKQSDAGYQSLLNRGTEI